MIFSDQITQISSICFLIMLVGMFGLFKLNPAVLRMRESRLKQGVEFCAAISALAVGVSLTLYSVELALHSDNNFYLNLGTGLLVVGGCVMAGLPPFSLVRIDVGEALPISVVCCYDLVSKLGLIYLLYVGVRAGPDTSEAFRKIIIPVGSLVACLGWLMVSVQSSFRRIVFYGSSAGVGVILLFLTVIIEPISNWWFYLMLTSFTLGYALLITLLVKGERKIDCSIHLMDLSKIFKNGRAGASLVFLSFFLISGAPVVSILLGAVQLDPGGSLSKAPIIAALLVSTSISFYAAATISLRLLNDGPASAPDKQVG